MQANKRMNELQRQTFEAMSNNRVPVVWFAGTPADTGEVEMIGLGQDWVWSILILPNGECFTSEAKLGDWQTGWEV